MTARLTRLRIAGFKSFAEPVSLDILPGLTGIVGPNGCGKSNVVEALRWAMGETSARSLRGGEMDDVIFAGTAARASRNLAEVTITLERSEEALPAPFEAEAELQLTRRIERGAGSAYRGNGRDMRARDVQTMFADLASGARSSAMVSQGRVAAIVNARPDERRQILEEAAGITGLHARRHEAELKLRAAEQNLAKAEDVRTQLEATRDGLRKQARQAARYRNISALVRGAEADLLATQHALAAAAVETAAQAQAQARAAVVAAEADCAAAGLVAAAAEAALPGPRAAEASARSLLERARLEAENLAQDSARAEAALLAATQRLADLQADAEDAGRAEADAVAACARLETEAAALNARLAALPDEIAAATGDVAASDSAAQQAGRDSEVATREAAAALAQATQARQGLAAAEARAAAAAAALSQAEQDLAAARLAVVDAVTLADAAARVTAAEQNLATARADAAASSDMAAEAARVLAAAQAARDRAVAEAGYAAQRRTEAAARADRVDVAHETVLAALRAAEAAQIAAADIATAQDAAEQAAAAFDHADIAVQNAEQASMTVAQAQLRAARQAEDAAEDARRAEARRDAAMARLATLRVAADKLAAEHAAACDALVPVDRMAATEKAARDAAAAEAASADDVRHLTEVRAVAESRLAAARHAAAASTAEAARLRAEIDGLRAALGPQGEAAGAVTDAVQVPADLEAAFGAALEDGQDFSLTPSGARFWRALPDMPPATVHPATMSLDGLLQAPDCLRRALSRIAVLDAGADGDALHSALGPGETLVSRDGAVWRWDGRVVRAGAPNAAAIRLRQIRRLRDAETDAQTAQARADAATAEESAALDNLTQLVAQHAAARLAQEAAELAQRTAQRALADLVAADAQARSHHAALHPAAARAAADRDQAAAECAAAAAACCALPPMSAALAAVADAKAQADSAAAALDAARAARAEARAMATAMADTLRGLQAARAEAAHRYQALRQQSATIARDKAEAAAALAEAAASAAALPDLAAVAGAADVAQARAAQAHAHATACGLARDRAHTDLDTARAALASLETARVQAETRRHAEENLYARALADQQAAADSLAAAQDALAALADADMLAECAGMMAMEAAERRSALAAASARLAALQGEQARAEARAPGLAAEFSGWQGRRHQAEQRRHAVLTRLLAADRVRQDLADAPATLAARAARSGDALAEAEAHHAAQAACLADAETAVRQAMSGQREADARLSGLRESFVRLESVEATAQAALHAVLARAVERLGPEAVLPEVEDASAPAEERARRKWERLQREREEMGPVNLRADLELEEIDGRLEGIERDREELTTAIAKLRGAIGHLNREGRERLSAVFTDVDRHFRTLFTRMMGGGRAHLALTGSDDPLLAGLEIYAEPPGKKLSTLSLLSGGEQALTALSLIFAVFRCTPAPVAVLDEVDAPLDDANVDRFCALLEDVVRETGTRFLVVTHHQVTMSRMDRLFGVTMQERGVSRLLSVDLRRAAEMVEAPPQAVAA